MANERILIVDDQPMVAQICAEILIGAGYQVSQVYSGQQALLRLQSQAFDLLVSDLKMPHLDGPTVLRQARQIHPNLAAIMITNYATLENAIQALRAGARDFLLKPFDPEDLVQTVGNVLAVQRQEQEILRLHNRLADVEESLQRERALQQALRESEASLARAQRIARLGNWDWDVKEKRLMLSDEAYRIFEFDRALELDRESIEAVIHPDDRAKGRELFEGLLVSHDSAETEFRMVGSGGVVKHLYGNAHVQRDQAGRAERIFGIVQDITQRKRIEQELFRRERELATLFEASLFLGRNLEPDRIGQELANAIQHFLDYEYGAVLVVDEDTGQLATLALNRNGLEEGDRIPGKWQIGQGVVGWVIEHGQAVRLGDVRRDPRYLPVHETTRSQLCVPLSVGARTIGALNLEASKPNAYDAEAERLLTALARQAALAIQNARLFKEVQDGAERLGQLSHRLLEAQEAQRRHIARELHDEIGQALTVLKINLQTARRLADDAEIASYLDDCVRTAADTLEQVRHLSLDLRPSLLDDLGLVPALRWHLDRQAQQGGFRAQLVSELPEGRLPPEIEIACFRIVQEALTNTMRHAGASEVSVNVRRLKGNLHLTIRDDGKGFDVQAARKSAARGESMGLLSIEERVHLLGGQIEIESEPGHGTKIWVRLPGSQLATTNLPNEEGSP